MVLNLIPAYGRNYKNKKEVNIAWKEGKDFKILSPYGSTYTNILDLQELKEEGKKYINIRYGRNNEKLHVINI